MTLPPGQHAVTGFPRYGTHLHHPPPEIPADPAIELRGPGMKPVSVPVADLATLPRRAITADFHCVARWSATGLRWEGVPLATLLERFAAPGPDVSHVVFGGLDRYRSVARLEDVTGDDVLVADRLDGHPLDGDHGAPVRLVSPGQYGYVNVKHLSRIELHTSEPSGIYQGQLALLAPHPRARVAEEERHRYVPAWALRLPYRLLAAPIGFLSRRG